MFARFLQLLISAVALFGSVVVAEEPLQRQTSSQPLVIRAPKISAEKAIELSTQFLRDHKKDPSAYFISELNWSSVAPEHPEADCWIISWVAKDRKAAEQGFTTMVTNQPKVGFGGHI